MREISKFYVDRVTAKKAKRKLNDVQIKKLIKTTEGTVKFEGELTEQEHEFVVTVGLHTLMENGALPFIVVDEEGEYHTSASFIPSSEEIN